MHCVPHSCKPTGSISLAERNATLLEISWNSFGMMECAFFRKNERMD